MSNSLPETVKTPWYKNKESYKYKLLDLLGETLANNVITLQLEWLEQDKQNLIKKDDGTAFVAGKYQKLTELQEELSL